MHVSPDTMKTIAFVLLMLLVAVYMHLAQAPRREPRSLIDFARHRHDEPEQIPPAPAPKARPRARRSGATESGR